MLDESEKVNVLSDPASERAILSAIYSYSGDAYFEVADIVDEADFTVETNRCIFQCFNHIFTQDTNAKLEWSLLQSASKELGLDFIFKSENEVKYIHALLALEVQKSNIRKFAEKISKLKLTRLLCAKLESCVTKLYEIEGSEPFSEILQEAENTVFEFIPSVGRGQNPTIIGDGLQKYITDLAENPVDQVGVSTGFPIFDYSIGGGLIPGSLNVVGARGKVGKSTLGENMGLYIAKKGIPVLNLDTEMCLEDHWNRMVAMESLVHVGKVKTGTFNNKEEDREKIRQSINTLQKIPYFYKSISGTSFEEQIAIIRRWIIKDVGVKEDGAANNCVIVYDYLKLMQSDILNNMQEYQALGLLTTRLKDLANFYKIPILAFVQLNRDGISTENTSVTSGSDRITWFCSNFTIFKPKSVEELAEDGEHNGTHKLIPLICRDGPGLSTREYINLKVDFPCSTIKEGRTNLQIINDDTEDVDVGVEF